MMFDYSGSDVLKSRIIIQILIIKIAVTAKKKHSKNFGKLKSIF